MPRVCGIRIIRMGMDMLRPLRLRLHMGTRTKIRLGMHMRPLTRMRTSFHPSCRRTITRGAYTPC